MLITSLPKINGNWFYFSKRIQFHSLNIHVNSEEDEFDLNRNTHLGTLHSVNVDISANKVNAAVQVEEVFLIQPALSLFPKRLTWKSKSMFVSLKSPISKGKVSSEEVYFIEH